MSTIWILIIFWGWNDDQGHRNTKAMTVAEFATEQACKSAIVPATTAARNVRAICVPKGSR